MHDTDQCSTKHVGLNVASSYLDCNISAYMLLFRLAISVSGYVLDAACRDGSSVPQGYQAIILGAPFKHNGSITAINAVMSFDPLNFAHAIYLQVWRPTGPSAFTVV